MAYVDGFVLVVPKRNVAAYRRMAKAAGRVWKKHGALEYRECVGDDLKVPKGCGRAFPGLAGAKSTDTVWFSFIVYKNRAHRDRVNKLVMKDPAMNAMMEGKPMPFDIARMAYGGFKVVVDL